MFDFKKTGHIEIDDQHHELLNAMSTLIQNCLTSKTLTPDVQKALSHFEEIAINHLNFEESLMKASNYPGIDNHLKQHEYFKNQVEDIKKGLQAQSPFAVTEMMILFKEWFLRHISVIDLDFTQFLLPKK